MSYSHLTREQRNHLYQLRQEQKLSQREIAKLLGCSQSTICRELKRNQTAQGWYLPEPAQILAQTRRKEAKRGLTKFRESIVKEVKKRLKSYHSPEQIAGRLKSEGQEWISHETIYQMIYKDYEGLGEYQKYLRQGRKKRKRRSSLKSKRGVIPNRVGILRKTSHSRGKKRDRTLGKRHNERG